MTITVNGDSRHLPSAPMTITMLLENMGIAHLPLAIARNSEVVPRSEHASTTLADGDKIEIVHAVGGG